MKKHALLPRYRNLLWMVGFTVLFSCSSSQVWIPPEIKNNKSALKSYMTEYRSFRHHKAFVVSPDGWSWAAGRESKQTAIYRAEEWCKKHKLRDCRVIDVDGEYIKRPFLGSRESAGKNIFWSRDGKVTLVGRHDIDIYSLIYDPPTSRSPVGEAVKHDYNPFSRTYNPTVEKFFIKQGNPSAPVEIIYYGFAQKVKRDEGDFIFVDVFDQNMQKKSGVTFPHSGDYNPDQIYIDENTNVYVQYFAGFPSYGRIIKKYNLLGETLYSIPIIGEPDNAEVVTETLSPSGTISLVYNREQEEELDYYVTAADPDGKILFNKKFMTIQKDDYDQDVLGSIDYGERFLVLVKNQNALMLQTFDKRGERIKTGEVINPDFKYDIQGYRVKGDYLYAYGVNSSDRAGNSFPALVIKYNLKTNALSGTKTVPKSNLIINDLAIGDDNRVFLLGYFYADEGNIKNPDLPVEKTLSVIDW